MTTTTWRDVLVGAGVAGGPGDRYGVRTWLRRVAALYPVSGLGSLAERSRDALRPWEMS